MDEPRRGDSIEPLIHAEKGDVMRHIRGLVLVLAAALIAAGCQSNFKVKDSKGAKEIGLPYRAPVSFVKTGKYIGHKEGKECAHVDFVTTVTLPVGQLQFLEFRPAWLGKAGFTAKFHENGLLSELSVNSDGGAEAAKSGVEAFGALLPILGVAVDGGAGDAAPLVGDGVTKAGLLPCNAVETDVDYLLLDDWLRARVPALAK